MADALKPCPFCGGQKLVVQQYGIERPDQEPSDGDFAVICDECGATGEEISPRSAAIAAWNRRAPRPSTEGEGIAYSQADYDEACEIAERDGYEKAVADIDRLTGGDGEYVFRPFDPAASCPDVETMTARIVDRFDSLRNNLSTIPQQRRG